MTFKKVKAYARTAAFFFLFDVFCYCKLVLRKYGGVSNITLIQHKRKLTETALVRNRTFWAPLEVIQVSI